MLTGGRGNMLKVRSARSETLSSALRKGSQNRAMRMVQVEEDSANRRLSIKEVVGALVQRVGRAPLVIALDATTAGIAYVCFVALALPADKLALVQTWKPVTWLVPLTVTGCLLFNVQRRSLRYVSISDLPALAAAVMLAIPSFGLMFRSAQVGSDETVRDLIFLGVLLFAFLVASRLIVRGCLSAGERSNACGIPTLIVGGGWTAENFIRASKLASGSRNCRAVGILTEHPPEIGRTIHGVPVLGSYDQFEKVVYGLRHRGDIVQQVALSSSRDEIDCRLYQRLYHAAQELGLEVARLPKIAELQEAIALPTDLRPATISDLLGRTQMRFDRSFEDPFGHSRVLITGAGGTIGSELSRQIAKLRPSELVLVDISEYNLYKIELELKETCPSVNLECVICDVRDSERIGRIFAQHRAELVFHAAAMKHVPIVERNPCEGILTNVLGTRNVADAALAYGVRAMTLISTDKAVDPQNVMGTTKRICEQYCQSLDAFDTGRTRFLAVRFGNVAASSGSVIPLFQRQIALGGPLTVTHPDVCRFFMTTEEAVELVLRATSLGLDSTREGGHVYVLDMGEPIRIAELAAQMIWLAGLVPGRDVEIEFVGLRPGEKLKETLFHETETVRSTGASHILEVISTPAPYRLLRSAIDDLIAAARIHDDDDARRLLDIAAHISDRRSQGPARGRARLTPHSVTEASRAVVERDTVSH
jgi:FlaA1/EpsC-like NDP-sugar epimerase